MVDYRGRETVAAWQYLPSMRWGMVVKIDTAEAFAPVARQRNIALAIGGVVLVLVVPDRPARGVVDLAVRSSS